MIEHYDVYVHYKGHDFRGTETVLAVEVHWWRQLWHGVFRERFKHKVQRCSKEDWGHFSKRDRFKKNSARNEIDAAPQGPRQYRLAGGLLCNTSKDPKFS